MINYQITVSLLCLIDCVTSHKKRKKKKKVSLEPQEKGFVFSQNEEKIQKKQRKTKKTSPGFLEPPIIRPFEYSLQISSSEGEKKEEKTTLAPIANP